MERHRTRTGRWRAGVPRRPGSLLDRQRLHEQLDTAAALTTVAAAAGAGKTWLLIGWAGAHAGDLVWVSAGRHEARFWSILANLLPRRSGSTSASPDATCLEQVERPMIVVIDDADGLDSSIVAELLEALESTPLLRFVVAGRDLRRFEGGGHALRYDRAVVPAVDLDFTLGETSAFLHNCGVHRLDDAIPLLHRSSSGSPAVLRAAVEAFANSPGAFPDGATRHIAELVAKSVVPRAALDADPDLLQFLHDTAAVEVLAPELAALLGGHDDPSAHLDRAVQLGLGYWTAQGWFGYSRVAGSVLRDAAECSDRERARRLGASAAQWLHDHGHRTEAFRAAVENGDHVLAERQVRDGVLQLLLQVRDDTRRLLETLPRETLMSHPLLAYLLALIYGVDRERRPRIEELLKLTLAGIRDRTYASTADELMGRAVQGMCLRAVRRLDEGAGPAGRALALVPQLNFSERASLGQSLPVAASHSALTLLYAGEYDEALAGFGVASAYASPNTLGHLMSLAMAAGAQALVGQINAARATLELVGGRAWPAPIGRYGVLFLHVAEALVSLERTAIGDARDAVQRAMTVERFTDQHEELLAYVQALVDIFGGDPLGAAERIESARECGTSGGAGGSFFAGLLTATLATAQLAAGLPAAARATLDGSPHETAPVRLARARVLLAMDLAADALTELGRTDRSHRLSTRQRAELVALEAVARLRLRDQQAGTVVQRLWAILAVHGLSTPVALLAQGDIAELRAMTDAPLVGEHEGTITSVMVPAAVVHLTPSEAAVLDALADTVSAADIAAASHVAVSTVKTHLRNMYRKLGVSSRDEALARASSVARTDRRRRRFDVGKGGPAGGTGPARPAC